MSVLDYGELEHGEEQTVEELLFVKGIVVEHAREKGSKKMTTEKC